MTHSTVINRVKGSFRLTWWQALMHIGVWLPFLAIVWDALHHHLTANPIQNITDRTGTTALVLLVLSLVCTPANTVFGIKQALKLRRPLGLYGFMYVGFHFVIFTVLDYGLDPGMILQAISDNRFVLAGLTALLLLTPLAITSTKGWMKRLGKNWKRLHALIYLAVPVVIVHFWWYQKADIRVPLQYATVVALLLLLRVPPVRRFVITLRYRLAPKVRQAGAPRPKVPADANLNEATSR